MDNQEASQKQEPSYGRELSYVGLHTELFIPGVGNVPKTLTLDKNGGKISGIKMYLSDENTLIRVELKGATFFIPVVQATHMVLKR